MKSIEEKITQLVNAYAFADSQNRIFIHSIVNSLVQNRISGGGDFAHARSLGIESLFQYILKLPKDKRVRPIVLDNEVQYKAKLAEAYNQVLATIQDMKAPELNRLVFKLRDRETLLADILSEIPKSKNKTHYHPASHDIAHHSVPISFQNRYVRVRGAEGTGFPSS